MNIERWKTFSKYDQLRHIAMEVKRAQLAQEEHNTPRMCEILERGMELIDASLEDSKWRGDSLLLITLRNEIARCYVGEHISLQNLYAAF